MTDRSEIAEPPRWLYRELIPERCRTQRDFRKGISPTRKASASVGIVAQCHTEDGLDGGPLEKKLVRHRKSTKRIGNFQ